MQTVTLCHKNLARAREASATHEGNKKPSGLCLGVYKATSFIFAGLHFNSICDDG